LYKFVVQKSKEPYFEMMDPFTPTPQTPAKVYLDNPKSASPESSKVFLTVFKERKKRGIPLPIPVGLSGKANRF
jgi:hypothetical protein